MFMFRLTPLFGSKSFFLITALFLSLFIVVILAEKKVSVSEVVFDSPVEDLQWLGVDHRTILCRTSKGRLYRSTDSGKNWIEVTDVLREIVGSKNRAEATVENIIVNPTDKDVVVVVGKKRHHFISHDAGKTFNIMKNSGSLHNFLFHPTRSTWALVSVWTEGCSSLTGESPCRHDLYFTKTLGVSMQRIASYVVQYAWGDNKTNQEDSVYFTHYSKSRGLAQPRSGGWSSSVHFSRIRKPGASTELLVKQGNKFLISNGYIFVAKLIDSARQTVALMVSTDGGSTFNSAKLPVPLQERSYTILDTSEDSVMLHVNHGHPTDDGISVGNIYISDAAGLRYSLSLPKNVRTNTGECEFDRVSALEGVYIGNFKAEVPPTTNANSDGALDSLYESVDYDDEDEEEDLEEEMESIETGVDKRRRQHRKGKVESMVRTAISFDKGGMWSYLNPPRIDSRGKKIECASSFDRPANETAAGPPPSSFQDLSGRRSEMQNDCFLHLHGITNFHRYAPFYSVGNAVGLIMGTGNVGSSLRYEEDQVNTYLSRDGGLNWVEAHKGAYIYEFGDHGGLIAMADDVKKTNQVVFSWNEGQSWYDFDLGDQQLNVDNIVIEPNSSSVEFLLYGSRGSAGVLYHLDFATLGQPPCKGVWAADSVSSDYETWTPTDGRRGDACILGKQMTFTRRKQTSECFNGIDFSRPVEKKNCTCTESDYECDFGFMRQIGGIACIPEDPSLTQEGCRSSGIFYADAYRKIPGDTCVGGWIPPKVAVKCPDSSPFSTRAKFVMLSTMGVMVLLTLATIWSEDPRLRAILGHTGVDSLSNAKYAVIGGAARFIDAFEFHMNPSGDKDVPNADDRQYRGRRDFDSSPDLEFVDSEQHCLDDVPPLLDFSSAGPVNELPSHNGGVARGGLQAATEAVPRLHPPPPSSTPRPIREYEML